MQLLLQAGADANVKDEFSTPFKVAGKKRMRVMEGEFKTHFIVKWIYFSYGFSMFGVRRPTQTGLRSSVVMAQTQRDI